MKVFWRTTKGDREEKAVACSLLQNEGKPPQRGRRRRHAVNTEHAAQKAVHSTRPPLTFAVRNGNGVLISVVRNIRRPRREGNEGKGS